MSSGIKTIDFINDTQNSNSANNGNSYFDSDFFNLNHNSILRDECDSPKKKKFRPGESPFLIPTPTNIVNNSIDNNFTSLLSSATTTTTTTTITDSESSFNNLNNNLKLSSNNISNNNYKSSPLTSNSIFSYTQPILSSIPNFFLSCLDCDSIFPTATATTTTTTTLTTLTTLTSLTTNQNNIIKNSVDENDLIVNNNNCKINNNIETEQSSETTTLTPLSSSSSSSNEIVNEESLFVNNNNNNIEEEDEEEKQERKIENKVDENQINNNNKPNFIYSINNNNNNNNSNNLENSPNNPTLEEDSFDCEENGSIYCTIHSEEIEDEEEEDEDESWNPLLFIKQLPNGMVESIVPLPKLPPKEHTAPKISLVLDLDETLVHCSTEPLDEPHLTFPVTFNNIEYQVFAKKRPFFEEFLIKMSENFELIIFTASQEIYASTLLNIIDPNNRITHRLYRDSCLFLKGNYLKDLRVLNRDLNHVVIVDNSPQSFGFHVDNGIPIESWFEDENDKELLSLVPFLESLRTVDDVRPLIREKYWKELMNV